MAPLDPTLVDGKVAAACHAAHEGAGEAVRWIHENRAHEPSLEAEGDELIHRLRRCRVLAQRLENAAHRSYSVGIFGESQVGKSYLVSSLAGDPSGALVADFGGEDFKFIGHINPPGSGKEATGLVTRFTRRPIASPNGFPVPLTLFAEKDLVKILGNSFFNDFDRDRVPLKLDPDDIRAHLSRFASLTQGEPNGGLSEDDVVDLQDYFERSFFQPTRPLKTAGFWDVLIDVAPRLRLAERAAMLSLLWGRLVPFTELFSKLAAALERLSHPSEVFAPLEALVVRGKDGYDWNPDSIVCVDVLERLSKNDSDALDVCAADGTRTHVKRSELAALTAEIQLVLANPPQAPVFEEVDLLDFPGYRSRLKLGSPDELTAKRGGSDGDPLARVFLRGKVAYLFERYTDDQSMNALIMCTNSSKQSEVVDIAEPLTAWIRSTQGERPEDRGSRAPTLLWALTMFDRRLQLKPDQGENQDRQEWANLIRLTMEERFSNHDWLNSWAAVDRPFDNVFLVRKPGLARDIFDISPTGVENQIRVEDEKRLSAAKQMFLAEPRVQRYVADAAAAWDAVLTLNDGGMSRLRDSLTQAIDRAARMRRIGEILGDRVRDLDNRLSRYHKSDAEGELKKKTELAERVGTAICEGWRSFGELLLLLQPDAEELRQLYLRVEADAAEAEKAGNTEAAPPRPKAGGFRLVSVATKPAAAQPMARGSRGRAERFAESVSKRWKEQLRNLPDSADSLRFVEIDRDALCALTDELITAFHRYGVEQRLVSALQPLEAARATTRHGIVDQQVMLARNVVNTFVDSSGAALLPEGERIEWPSDPSATAARARRVFDAPPAVPDGTVPTLPPEDALSTAELYINDWLLAFRQMAESNAGRSVAGGISVEQNRRLGAILAKLRSEAP